VSYSGSTVPLMMCKSHRLGRWVVIAGSCWAAAAAGPAFEVCTEEARQIVLVKTHKTGSSTLANVLYRWDARRNHTAFIEENPCNLLFATAGRLLLRGPADNI
jgi:hypothetical protein